MQQFSRSISLVVGVGFVAWGSQAIASPMELSSTTLQLPEMNSQVATPEIANLALQPAQAGPIDLTQPISTSAEDLIPEPAMVAQRVGDRTRGFVPTAYIGAGANIGWGDNTDLGRGRFLIYGKYQFAPNVAVRPAIALGNNSTFAIPLTYEFPIQPADAINPTSFVPYLGGGIVISTGDANNFGFLLSGGVDFPISREFTATAGLNVGFIRNSTDYGILLGVAYNLF
jgi:hypothetical protein